MNRKKLTPEQFGLAYGMAKIKNPNISVRKLATLLQISPTTCQGYLTSPDYQAQIDTKLIQEVMDRGTQKKIDRAEEILDTAFKLNSKRIRELITTKEIVAEDGTTTIIEPTQKDWEDARIISLQMLNVAKTEAEVKRVFSMIQVNIDARQQTVNIESCNRCMDDIIDEIVTCLCGKCKTKVVNVVMAQRQAEVIA